MIKVIKKKIKKLSRSTYATKKIMDNTVIAKRKLKYKEISKNVEVEDKTILFESFFARKYECSPRAIYEYMANSPEYKEYRFIWAFNDPDEMSKHFEGKNTEFVKAGSQDYLKAFARSKYWVRNTRLPEYITKKREQVYIQCWHGTPLKKIGCDIEVEGNNPLSSNKLVKKQYTQDAKQYSYMLSPSKYCTEKFISAFNLEKLNKKDVIIEEGYPRNDALFTYDDGTVKKIKEKIGIDEGKKVILYAPTFRDNQHKLGVGFTYDLALDLGPLMAELGDEYVVLLRLHYHIANHLDLSMYEGFAYDVSRYDNINDIYIVSDLLITDYSSVFFDYANLKRPILFYMYDLEEYRGISRDFYISLDELPGPVVTEENDLINVLNDLGNISREYADKYNAFNLKYNYLDDAFSSKRVVDICFNK